MSMDAANLMRRGAMDSWGKRHVWPVTRRDAQLNLRLGDATQGQGHGDSASVANEVPSARKCWREGDGA